MELRRIAAIAPSPWRNGRGTTRELVAEPPGEAWTWRISVADVTGDDDFSVFAGIDRTILVAAGAGMALTIDGVEVVLDRPFVPVPFDGGARTTCRLLDGPLRDVNLMVRRDAASGRLDVVRAAPGEAIQVVAPGALVVLDGTLAAGGETLGALDAVVGRSAGTSIEGVAGPAGATVAAVAVRPR